VVKNALIPCIGAPTGKRKSSSAQPNYSYEQCSSGNCGEEK